MSVHLTDALIDLADPKCQIEFQSNPEVFLGRYELTADERNALLSKNPNKLRVLAKPVDTFDETQQFNLLLAAHAGKEALRANMEVTVDELHVEISVDSHEQIAISGHEALFVDHEGRWFKGVAVTND